MKRIIAIALCLVLVLGVAVCGFAACGNDVNDRIEALENKTTTLENDNLYLGDRINSLERERDDLGKEIDALRKEKVELEKKLEDLQDDAEFLSKIDTAMSMIVAYIVQRIIGSVV